MNGSFLKSERTLCVSLFLCDSFVFLNTVRFVVRNLVFISVSFKFLLLLYALTVFVETGQREQECSPCYPSVMTVHFFVSLILLYGLYLFVSIIFVYLSVVLFSLFLRQAFIFFVIYVISAVYSFIILSFCVKKCTFF